MKTYRFVGTEQDLIDNGFIYRKHYDNYLKLLAQPDAHINIERHPNNGKDIYPQDFSIEIIHRTGEVNIFTRALKGYPHEDRGNQYDISHKLIMFMVDLVNKGLLAEVY